ncbi:MAG: recombinase family protein [Planctomycetota bacterium]
MGEVCRRLARQGIPSPRGKTYGDRGTVWGILKNLAYKGSAAFVGWPTSFGGVAPTRSRLGLAPTPALRLRFLWILASG